jgi:hypothetical protein
MLDKGIHISLLDGRFKPAKQEEIHYQLNMVENLDDVADFELIIVCVRHYQLNTVLPIISENLGYADVLIFNGNWEGISNVNKVIPQARYLWGFPVAGGGFKEGKLDGALLDVVRIGEMNGQSTGWKNRENKIPADPHSLFKIASIGKLYDAVAITKLVNDKRLSLDKTRADYYPELVGRIENAEKITLRMMVQHRSGIPNLTDTPNFWINPPENNKEAIERVLELPADFEPGEDYEYSNTNYLLISEIINSIRDVNMDNVMSGYYFGIEQDIKTANYGSMLAAAEDVGIFLRALNDGSLFDEIIAL